MARLRAEDALAVARAGVDGARRSGEAAARARQALASAEAARAQLAAAEVRRSSQGSVALVHPA